MPGALRPQVTRVEVATPESPPPASNKKLDMLQDLWVVGGGCEVSEMAGKSL